VVMMTAL